MPTIDISAGTIHYEATGPENGRPVVFVHGYMMGGQLVAPGQRTPRRARPAVHRPHLAAGRTPAAVAPRRRPNHHRRRRHCRR